MMEPDSPSGLGVNLIAYIRAEMGLGTAARGIAHALESAGVPFNVLNFEHSNPSLHRDESWKHKEVNLSSYDFTILAVNPDNIFNARARVQKRFVRDRYTIGCWSWELPEIPDAWLSAFSLVDEVWAPSRFVQDAISLKSPVPVFLVPHAVRLGPTDKFSRRDFSLPEQQFLFLSMSDTRSHLARKNPLGVIRAFKKAFRRDNKDVGLILKINNVNTIDADQETLELIREEIEGYRNIYLLDSDMTRAEIDALLGVSDCFISLHRSEGFGLGPAEAMSLGKPVILTKWSGNIDYMTPDNSIGIDYQLVPVGKQYGPYQPDQLWADPDLKRAAFWMKRLVKDPEFGKKMGLRGQETIKKEFSPEAVGQVIQQRLNYLHGATVARRAAHAKSDDPDVSAQLQFFASRGGAADPEHSTKAEVIPGQWCRLKIDLPWGLGDGSSPFRFDPVDRPGMVDLAAVILRAGATGKILWRADTRGGLYDLTIRGTALRLPHERLLRFLSYAEDPQVYLPYLTGDIFEEPLTLEILLRFDPAPQNVERVISGWNESMVSARLASLPEAKERAHPTVSSKALSPPDDQITMVVYSAEESGYTEERATQVTYTAQRWSHLDIALQLGLGTQPLRLDPLTAIGLIDVAAVTIRSAINDEVLWRANGGAGLEALQVSGSAVRIPHPHLARILSYGKDPQIYLPAFSKGKFDGPLRLELWLKTETGVDSIRKGITELAAIGSRALEQGTQTRGLLEQSTRDASQKDNEIQALRTELERNLSDGKLQIENLRASLNVMAAETSSQKGHIQNLETIRSEQELELRNLKTSLETQQSEIGSQQGHISKLEAIRSQLESEAAILHQSLHRARVEGAQFLAQLEAERADHLKLQADTQGEIEARESEREKQIEDLKASLEAAQRDLAGVSNDLTRGSDELARASLTLVSRTSELGQFRQELALTRNELNYAKSELERAGGATIRREQELRLRVLELEKTGQEATSTMNSLAAQTAELDRLRREFESASAELTLIRAEIVHRRRQLLGQENLTAELRLKLNGAKEKLKAQKSELEQIKNSALWKAVKPIRKLRRHYSKRTKHSLETELYQDDKSASYDFWLEQPSGPSFAGRNIIFSGWVIGPSRRTIHGLRAVANGQIFPGQYGFVREDVAITYAGRVGATHAGFSIDVTLPAGISEVSLEALNSKGEWEQFLSHRHDVKQERPEETEQGISAEEESKAGNGASHAGTLTIAPDDRDGEMFLGALDTPGPTTTNETGLLFITGWLYFKEDKVNKLSAHIGAGPTVLLTYSLPRVDVAKTLSHLPEARACGFEGYLPIGPDFSGPIILQVHTRLESGREIICFQREAVVQPAPLPVTRSVTPPFTEKDGYEGWLRTNRLTPMLLKRMAQDAARIATTGPLISVVVPTFNTPPAYLEALIDSLRTQLYPNWQLCVADDASTEPHVRSILEKAAASDSRVEFSLRSANGHIAKASNTALDLAKGEYVGLLDHDDVLTPDALLQVAEAILAQPAVDFLYTDEDKLSPAGVRYDPIFKGAFSPEMSITHNYIQHFAVIRTSLLRQVGGFREGFEGAQDLDLYLRVIERTVPGRVRHLPFVCYHWRSHPESTASTAAQKKYVFESARRSVEEALTRRGIRATAFLPDWAKQANCCLYQLRWSPELLRESPVTIVIPTKNRGDLLKKCVDSIVRTVDTTHAKLIVVDDFSDDEATRHYLKQLSSQRDLDCEVIRPSSQLGEFNFSHLVNTGVAHATTPLVLLLNNDTEALRPGWLEEMVGWMSIKGVGAVGAKLLYPDGTVQHAGVIVGSHGGLADHLFHRLDKDIIGFNFLTHAARNVSAVTAACMLTSKAVFNEMKGFDEANLGMEYNDVDYCLRLGQAGKRIMFTPQAALLHHCGRSRGVGFRPREHVNFLRRYPGVKDPFYNASLDSEMPVKVNPRRFVHAARIERLRVLDISHNLNLEGAPKVSFDRAAYFATKGGYDITVASHSDGPLRRPYEEAGISVTIVKPPVLEFGESATEFAERLMPIGQLLDTSSFDLIICSTLVTSWGVLLAKSFALPVIWHIHESTALETFFQHVPALAGSIEGCFAYADRTAFEAESTRRIFDRYDTRGSFVTMPGSVDVDAVDAFCQANSKESLRRKHGIETNAIVVSLIGTTCARKGQHVFVEAIKKLQSEGPAEIAKVHFLMLGGRESPYLEFLEWQLQQSGVKNTRIIEEREEVYDFYRLTDIFVCASFQESFPRVILEAMAFKLGIVSTNVFGIAEMIADGEEGYLVAPGDTYRMAERILWLVQNPAMRRQLGDKAHSKATRLFNNRVQLRKRLDLTKEVVARHT